MGELLVGAARHSLDATPSDIVHMIVGAGQGEAG
jgi:hypothetical protein